MAKKRTLAFALMLACAFALFAGTALADDGHSIAVASDRHGNEERVAAAFSGMPDDVEYVSLIGDMVGTGTGKDAAPEYSSLTVFNEILGVGFANISSLDDAGNASILWADHDAGVNDDDAGIVFANGGYESGLMRTLYDGDEVVCYIYGIGYYQMATKDSSAADETREAAEAAAREFEEWVDAEALPGVPIIALCHAPLHYARGDNYGAQAWSAALNYAATGVETTEAGHAVVRNVVFLHGHNHTNESGTDKKTGETYSGEFFVPCGSTMEIGATADDWTTTYYTYTTAGYLKQAANATLITVDDSAVAIEKYHDGVVTDNIYDDVSKASGAFASCLDTLGAHTVERVQPVETALPDGCAITYADASGASVAVAESGTVCLTPGEWTATVSLPANVLGACDLSVKQGGDALPVTENGAGSYSFTVPEQGASVELTLGAAAAVSGVNAKYTYTGKALQPAPTVTLDGKTLVAGYDYTVSYKDNTNAGAATVTVTGKGEYAGTISKSFTIAKAKNTITVKGKTAMLKYSKVKKAKQTVAKKKAFTVSKAKGKVTFKKVSGNKKIKVSSAGKITVKKGLKKGAYKVKVKVTAAGTANYKKLSKTVTVKVKVK